VIISKQTTLKISVPFYACVYDLVFYFYLLALRLVLKMEEYEVLEMVGEGSFGRVFKARHRIQRNLVALKFIPKVCLCQYGTKI
jgi:serine/threonine protein kinase